MSENKNTKKIKNDNGTKKIKRCAIMSGVVLGMGATFVLSSVLSLFSKGAEKRLERKERKAKNIKDSEE